MYVLVINAGSSSLKYQYINTLDQTTLCSGLADRIGLEEGSITHKAFRDGREEKLYRGLHIPDHAAAMNQIAALLTDKHYGVIRSPEEVKAVGHRVVHGGEAYSHTVRIDADVKANIRRLSRLVPLHNPANLTGIEMAEKIFPAASQVAVFDTAFHQTMPPVAYRYAIPNSFYEEEGIRVFGFHGISHQYVAARAAAYLQDPGARLITLHLGNGCSMTAVQNGQSLDTSMGLGALDGLVMGTRSGQLDPTVVFYMTESLGYPPDQVAHILNKESGLKGLSGFSDMRDVESAVKRQEPHALLAADMYAYRIRKFIGAYAAVMNGLDALVFTAGVGENDAAMRERVCERMDFLGIRLNTERNNSRGGGLREIQPEGNDVKVLVIPTNEELEIALETARLLLPASSATKNDNYA